MTSILALFVLLIGGGVFFGHQYLNSQYYVGTSNGKVVIFRGLDQQLFGVSLSSVYHTTGIPVAGMPVQDVQAIRQDSPGSLAQATTLVTNIRNELPGLPGRPCGGQALGGRQAQAGQGPGQGPSGKIVFKTVTPKYRPKPPVPADCPPQPASGT